MEYPPNTLVPIEKRLEVYQRALRELTDPESEFNDIGLCLLLPVILWNLKSYLDDAEGEYWDYHHTKNMFPEISNYLVDICYAHNPSAKRIEVLEEIIAELNKEAK